MAQTIAFIGLGNMGLPMAINLLKAGHEVRGFDVVPAANEAAAQAGIAVSALNTQVLADLIAAFAAHDSDASQHCLVLTGNEKAFAAGADIKQMQP